MSDAASPTQWLLRASKYGGGDGAMDAAMKAALKSLEAGDTQTARTALAALAAALKRPARMQYDEKLAYVGALYFVAQRLGDAARVKQATQLYTQVIKSLQADPEYFVYAGPRAVHTFERYKRGIENSRFWLLGADEIPLEVWVPFLDALRARRDNEVPRCRAALKQLDAAVGRALAERGMRKKLFRIGGEYAIAHGFCGNVAKVREILKKLKGPFDGPKPEQAFEALFLAGDRKGAAAVASRELNERLREVTGKAGPVAAMNAHHSLSELEDIFQAQLKAGDRVGVARGLEAVAKALGGRPGRNAETRAWALKTVADMEMRISRPDRARAANALAEKLAAKSRGAEVRSMSWRGVAEVYAKLGEWEKAQAAIAKIPSRHEKLGATVAMLVHRGDMDQVAREIAKMKGNEAKRHACGFVAEVLEERAGDAGTRPAAQGR